MSNFDFDDVDGTAQDEIQFSAPSVFWKHGSKKFKESDGINHLGGFFFTYEQAGADAEIPGWQPSSFVGDNDKEIEGLSAFKARIIIVRSRRRWFKDDGGQMTYRAWNDYVKGFRGQMQSVGFIQGYDAPVCFTFKGMAVSRVEEVIRYHSAKVVSVANKEAPQGRKLPGYALWMNVMSGKHEKVGSGRDVAEVTMPELYTPKVVDLEYARKLYVGRDMLIAGQTLYRGLDEWAAQWNRFAVDPRATPLGAEDRAFEQEVKRSYSQPEEDPYGDDIPF